MNNMDLEFRNQATCLWCERDLCQHSSRVITTKDWALNSQEIYAYVKCNNCKSLTLVNPPVERQLSLYYPSDYSPYVAKVEALGTIDLPYKILSRLVSSPRSNINILDYGCGNGTWLAQAANTFESATLHAVDFDPSEAISRIRWIGKDVNVVSPQQFLLSQKVYDIIHFGHSIEHVRNPIEVIKGAALQLSQGGVLIIACPVSDSLSFALFGPFWFALDAPRHFSVPSISALDSALTASALSIIQSQSYGSPITFDRSVNYAIQNRSRYFLPSKFFHALAKSDSLNEVICRFHRSSKYRIHAQKT